MAMKKTNQHISRWPPWSSCMVHLLKTILKLFSSHVFICFALTELIHALIKLHCDVHNLNMIYNIYALYI